MGRVAAGNLTERVTLTLPAAAVSDGRGGFRPGTGSGAAHTRPARVRVLRAAEATRYGLAVGTQAWEVTVRATHPMATDPLAKAAAGRLTWNGPLGAESGAVVSVEPDERREYWVLLVSNQRGNG